MSSIELEVYRGTDPLTPVDILPGRMEPAALDELKGPGAVSFKIRTDDPRILADPTLLDYRNIIKARVNGKYIQAGLIQIKNETYVDENEKADEIIEVSGEGLRTWFHDAAVYPYNGVKLDSADDRIFSFASEQGDWYVSSDWVAATKVAQYLHTGTMWAGTAPASWPDEPNAWWIWDRAQNASSAPPLGACYFRYEFDLAAQTSLSLFIAADDCYEVYLDAQNILEVETYGDTWNTAQRVDMVADAGHHILAVRVRNMGTVRAGNIAGLIAAMRSNGDPAVPSAAVTLFKTGDTGWKVLSYPEVEPGWTSGEILIKLINEAKIRGVRFANILSPTFTSAADSNGDPWDDAQAWTFSVGAEYTDVLDKLEELSCDIWIDPDTYELNATKSRGTDHSVPIGTQDALALRKGKNVVKANEEGTADIKTWLLIQTDDGWVEASAAEVDTSPYGRVEGQITTNAGQDLSAKVAEIAFEQKSTPNTSTSFEFLSTNDITPFEVLKVGDYCLAPGKTGLEKRRVFSLSAAEDEAGNAVFAAEFDSIVKERLDRLEKMLDNISDGASASVLGTMSNVGISSGGGGTGSAIVIQNSSGGSSGGGGGTAVTAPAQPAGLAGSVSGYWDHDGDPMCRVNLHWTQVNTDTAGASLIPDHYNVWYRRNRTTLQRTFTNLHTNPSFELNTTGAAGTNATISQVSSWAIEGTKSLQITPSVTSPESYADQGGGGGGLRSGMAPGNVYTASAYLHLAGAQAGTLSVYARTLAIVYRDVGGVLHTVSSVQAPNVAGTYRLAVTAMIPAGATEAWVRLYNGTGSATPTNVQWDGVMVTLGDKLLEYFDGATASDATHTYTWTGTAQASTSTFVATDPNILIGTVKSNAVTLLNMVPSEDYTFGVTAVRDEGVESAVSSEINLTTVGPDQTVMAPTAPLVSTQYGGVTVGWDGLLAGAAPNKIFDYVFMGYSSTANGTYTNAGQSLKQAGSFHLGSLSAGTTVYFKLFAVDRNGVVSPGSDPSSIVVSDGAGGATPLIPTMPIGAIVAYTSASLPSGWSFCDGSAVSRSAYSELFAVIGTSYGAGNGTTTFNLPDLRGRSIIGYDSTQTEFDTLGETGGEKTHTLSNEELPDKKGVRFSWGASGNVHFQGGDQAVGGASTSNGFYTFQNDARYDEDFVTGGQAHNNLQPYMALNYIIRAVPGSFDNYTGPIGSIIEGHWATAPAGYLMEDGSAISRSTYAALFSLLGTTYGVGDGSTTFNLPDARGRVLVQQSADTEFDVLGETGGEKTHVLTIPEMPSHTHTPVGGNAFVRTGGSTGWVGTASGFASDSSTAPTGGGGAHNNLQPYIVVSRAIKY